MDSDSIADFPDPIRRRTEDDGWPSVDLATVLTTPEDALRRLGSDIDAAGGAMIPDPDRDGAVGFTMFDSPGSEDNSVTVLLAAGTSRSCHRSRWYGSGARTAGAISGQ